MNAAVSSGEDIASYYSPVLGKIFALMLTGGMRKEAIRALSARSLELAEENPYRYRNELSDGLPMAALVLDAWHRDRRYLNANAQPRAVPLLGAAPSVEALIRAESQRKDAQQLARRLRSLRLLTSTGRGLYKPASDVALVSTYDPFVLQHIARSLSSLLETIDRNLQSSGTESLIERFAEVPDLPDECIPAFQQFTKLHGWILLRTVNDWLESRRARRSGRSGKGYARAGIHIHAYVSQKSKKRNARGSIR
jgi:hypothetical protein